MDSAEDNGVHSVYKRVFRQSGIQSSAPDGAVEMQALACTGNRRES